MYKFYLIYVLPLPLLFFSLLIGPSQQFSIVDFLHAVYYCFASTEHLTIVQQDKIEMMQNIMLNVRMPRIFLTFMVGAALASSGNALQALFRNPLVDSYVLGISSGAALGAAIALLFSWLPVQISAFIFGIVAVCLTYGFAYQRYQKSSVVVVLLSGMIVSGLFIAGLSIVQYLSDPYKLQAIVQWTMGNLHQATWQKVQQSFSNYCFVNWSVCFTLAYESIGSWWVGSAGGWCGSETRSTVDCVICDTGDVFICSSGRYYQLIWTFFTPYCAYVNWSQ